MRVRSSVFGSGSERALYHALNTRWSDKLSIYTGLPFAMVIDCADSDLAPNEKRFLFRTSLDYTLCDKSDHPLLSIEFDGLGKGFSRNGKYVPRYIWPKKDPNRVWKLNLKLRICESLLYPLFVISFEEAKPLGPDVSFAIVDGVIGHYLAGISTQGRINELVEDNRDQIDALGANDPLLEDLVQDLVLEAEVEMEMTWNPLARQVSDLQSFLLRYEPSLRFHVASLDSPEVARAMPANFPDIPNVADLRARWEALGQAERMGSQATVFTSKGDVTESVWVRNVGDWLMASSIASEIAQLLAFKKALRLFTD